MSMKYLVTFIWSVLFVIWAYINIVHSRTPAIELTPYVKTPVYALATDATPEFNRAVNLIAKYGNSDEFYGYMKSKRKTFSHTPMTRDQAISHFRAQLDRADLIPVDMLDEKDKLFQGGWYVGGFNHKDQSIKENKYFRFFRPRDRAGHLLHETAHKYGFQHAGNDMHSNDNLNSFPYAAGIDFIEFLELKGE